MLLFGAGEFFAKPLQDVNGVAIPAATAPTFRLGVVQEVSLELSSDFKELYGQETFPVDVARGKSKIAGKITGANLSGAAISQLYFGTTPTAGTATIVNIDRTGTAIPGTPFTITVTPPGGGTFVEDMGVINASGLPMTKVASAPTTGQYSNVAGVYTFASADTAQVVNINYRYTVAAAGARSINLTNTAMGNSPTITAFLQVQYQGKTALVTLSRAIFGKLALLGTKIDDHSIPSMDFSAFTAPNGSAGSIMIME